MSSALASVAAAGASIVYVQATSEVGGSDVALYRLVTHLDRGSYRPVVLLPREGPLSSRLRDEGITVAVLPMVQLRPLRSIQYQARFVWHFWPTVIRLAALLGRENAALVHSNTLYAPYGAWAALVRRIPHVWHIREIPDLPPFALSAIARLVTALSARVVPMTREVARRVRFPDSAKVVPIPDGIDLDVFNPQRSGARIRAELGVPPEAPLVGFVGRLDPWKGVDTFLRAAAGIARSRPDARFLVCGGALDGHEPHADALRRLALELGLHDRVAFTGWHYRLDDIPEVMAALDVLVHSSVRPEPFGLVLVEAMATAKPVVAAAAGGPLEIVEDGVTGRLVRPGDYGAVAKAVLEFLRDPAAARAAGRAGRARAERLFDVRTYAARMEGLYRDVLGRGAAK